MYFIGINFLEIIDNGLCKYFNGPWFYTLKATDKIKDHTFLATESNL